MKTETRCPDCGGRIVAIRDLADELGAVELEEQHVPGCPADRPRTVGRSPDDDARGLASQPALWAHRRERSR